MRLYYLDVLKAFAIIAVVLYHSGFMSSGYLGVDLFLVINGYLITKSLNKRILVSDSKILKGYLDFELSRVIRLLPVLLIAGVICMTIGYVVMLPDDYENLSQSVIASNLFGNNILSAITTKDYWDVVNEYKPLMHTWYVGIVMQFYLVYPVLFFFARLDKKNAQRTLLTMISVLAVISLLIYFGITSAAARFYYLPSRFFEFAVGGIVALSWNPKVNNKPFYSWFVFVCYALLLTLIAVNTEMIPTIIKLVLVVALSVVLLMSGGVLNNRITANGVLAKIGAASYSIFVWHQVLLAFYRYTYSSHFTVTTYVMIIVATAILSWLTYLFIEQKTSAWLKNNKKKILFYTLMVILWVGLTVFSGYIYLKGGVVRDVPELYINKKDKVNHKDYNDNIYKLDKPFETKKQHWLVIGNSFGRDFANVILESPVADSVEVSYIYYNNYKDAKYGERFASADRVFLSSLGIDEYSVREVESVCLANGFNIEKLVIVGTKNFGESNGQIYIQRNTPSYYSLRVKMENGYLETNERMKSYCGDRYLDLIGLVIDEKNTMPAFTPDHHFVSQDCRHFSMGGAKWFSQLIDWGDYMDVF